MKRRVYRYLMKRRVYRYLMKRRVCRYLMKRPDRGKNTQLGRTTIWVCNGKGIRKVNMVRALRTS
jgi:hypothetical protein